MQSEPTSHDNPNYKWVIFKHTDGVYAVTGYALVKGVWLQDTATVRWTYIDAVLTHIHQRETDLHK